MFVKAEGVCRSIDLLQRYAHLPVLLISYARAALAASATRHLSIK